MRKLSIVRLLSIIGLATLLFSLSVQDILARGGGHSYSSHSSGYHSSYSGSTHTGSHTSHSGTYNHTNSGKSSQSYHSTGSHSSSYHSSYSSSGSHKSSHTASTHSKSNYCTTCPRDKNGHIKRSSEARSAFMKSNPCPSTGKSSGRCPGYVVDHIKPLKRGGADSPSNMQWQTTQAAKDKDKRE